MDRVCAAKDVLVRLALTRQIPPFDEPPTFIVIRLADKYEKKVFVSH